LGFNRPKRCGKGCGFGILVSCFLMLVALVGIRGWGQNCPANRCECVSSRDSTAGAGARTSTSESLDAGSDPAGVNAFAQWEGLPVRRIAFEGVPSERLSSLDNHLAQVKGAPLDR